jgi:REP element-mobilizing transposase RayT
MSELKFRNKYRIPSNRLKNWDYGRNSAYFITICTKNREHFFGEINNGKMQLNELGKNAIQFWMEIPNHFPFIELGNFVVMPNHTHGILIIDKPSPPPAEMPNLGISTISTTPSTDMPKLGILTPTTQPPSPEMPKLGISTGGKIDEWKPGTIGVIINQYKRMVTIHNRKINPNFAWQSNYHDHIIRNSISFENIQNYIENNPSKWKEDTFCK